MAKGYKRLTIYDRMDIQAAIHDHKTITEIAKMLKVSKSTISRELNREIAQSSKCPILKRIATCNICCKKIYCKFPKLYYDFSVSQTLSDENKVLSRKKSQLSKEQIKTIDTIVTSLIKKGQSLHHIYASDITLKTLCSERTLRRLIYRNELSIGPSFLRRYVRFKHKTQKTTLPVQVRDIKNLIGRTYRDYLNYVKSHKRQSIVQFDSVIGKIKDRKAILTITLPKYAFQFGLLIEKGNAESVVKNLIKLFKKIGPDAKNIFQINLCDNGTEFATFYEIEKSVGKTFYTSPYQSNNKAECERNHEFIRYVIPKGKSLDNLTQDFLDEMFSNINSYVRHSKNDKTPYDLVKQRFGVEFLNKINIRRIPNKKVSLSQLI